MSVKMTTFTCIISIQFECTCIPYFLFLLYVLLLKTVPKTVPKNQTKARNVFNYFYCFIFVKFSILIGAHKQRGAAIQK